MNKKDNQMSEVIDILTMNEETLKYIIENE